MSDVNNVMNVNAETQSAIDEAVSKTFNEAKVAQFRKIADQLRKVANIYDDVVYQIENKRYNKVMDVYSSLIGEMTTLNEYMTPVE